jgi:hypothetical protein
MCILFHLSFQMCEMKLVHTKRLVQPGLTVCREAPVYVRVYHPRHTVNPHLYLSVNEPLASCARRLAAPSRSLLLPSSYTP